MKGNSLEKMLMKNDIKNRVCDIKKVLCYQKSYGFISQKNDIKSETYDIKKKEYLLTKMLQKKMGRYKRKALLLKVVQDYMILKMLQKKNETLQKK